MNTFDPDFALPTLPAFLSKLWLLVDDSDTNDLIYWDPDGSSFHICDGNCLAKDVLPLYFKHNNLSSFIRQLNMYGFRKVNRVDPTMALKTEVDDMEFKHPYFIRSKPHLMSKIQRKPHANMPGSLLLNGRGASTPIHFLSGSGLGPSFAGLHNSSRSAPSTDIDRLYVMIQSLRSNQETMSNQIALVQSENQLLYRELNELRERHEQQSQLIQTLFTFLSAFAKDTKHQNLRFGPNKRRALPFTSSHLLNTPSHSGLKLNLPQGFDLDGYTKSMHSLQRAAYDEAISAPYKIAKMDFKALPASAQDVTRSLSPRSPEALTQSIAQYSPPHPTIYPEPGPSQQSSQHLRPAFANRLSRTDGKGTFPRITQVEQAGSNDLTASDSSASLPVTCAAAAGTNPIVFNSHTENYLLHPAWKPATSDEDRTLTSLIRAPTRTSTPASPLSVTAPNTYDGIDNSLTDLNLSRCTTPASIVQPDSVDLSEFLAAAVGGPPTEEDEPEINMDDLFLTSSELENSNSSPKSLTSLMGQRGCKPGKDELSFDGGPSLNLDSTVGLPDVCAEEVISSGGVKDDQVVEPIDTADLDQIMLDPISDSASTEVDSLSQCGVASGGGRVHSSLTTSAHQMHLNDSELFGLPWEVDMMNEPVEHEGPKTELLPSQENASRPTKGSLQMIKGGIQAPKGQQYGYIKGNEIIPVESAIPFANVSVDNLVQILHPVTTVSSQEVVSTHTAASATRIVPAVTGASTPKTGHISSSNPPSSTSPPLIRSKVASRPLQTVLPRTVTANVISGTAPVASLASGSVAAVSNTSCVIPVLPLTTVALGQPVLAATNHPVTLAMPTVAAPLAAKPIRPYVRPTAMRSPTVYKKIAPAPIRALKPTTGSHTASQQSNSSVGLPDLSSKRR